MSRYFVTIARWVDILLLVFLSVCVFFMAKSGFLSISERLSRSFSEWQHWVVVSFFFIVGLFFAFLISRLKGVRHSFNVAWMVLYPPFWISAVIGLAAVLYISESYLASSWDYYFPVFYFISGFFFFLLLGWFGDFSIENGVILIKELFRKKFLGELNGDEKNIIDWIMSEEPIKNKSSDIFGHSAIADRIYSYICSGDSVHVAILGDYGAGKSSVINLLQCAIESEFNNDLDKKFITCRVDAWGRSGADLPSSILSLSIEEMSKHFDCLSLGGIPEKYKAALGGLAGGYSFFMHLFEYNEFDAIYQLRRISKVLGAVGIKLLVIIEDIDRSFSRDDVLNEVSSLMDRLKQVSGVSFVISLSSESEYYSPVSRVCDYVESV